MQQRHTVSEIGGKAGHHLRCQRNLRDKDHHGFSPSKQLLHQLNVHQCFAASCNTLQQRYTATAVVHAVKNILISLLLLAIQCNEFWLYRAYSLCNTISFLRTQRDNAAFFQRSDGLTRNTGKIAQLMDGRFSLLQQKLHGIMHTRRRFLMVLCPALRLIR